jgi:deoxyribose-phosphate aldolase
MEEYFFFFFLFNLYCNSNLQGGIKSAKDAAVWLSLMKEELTDEWTTNKLFRIGASSLLGDIERQIFHYVYGRYAAANELP